jgi:methionyl-tRNA formyltransferase
MPPTAAVFAYHDVGARCLRVLLDHGVDVRLVVTHRDDPAENVFFESVAKVAQARGLDVEMPEDPNTPEFVRRLQAIAPDFIFSFYYRRMLSAAVLATAKRGAYNMHGSLLPRYRGRAPVNWAVLKGERETGATLHEMVAKPDAGGIVGQQAVAIGENDLAIDVFRRVTEAAEAVLRGALPALLDGSARVVAQDLASGSYFGGRRPEDGQIDWQRPAREIHDLVRAVAPPYPGAFATLEGRPTRILQTWWGEVPSRLPPHASPGTVAKLDDRAFVRCGDGRWLEVRRMEIMGESAR